MERIVPEGPASNSKAGLCSTCAHANLVRSDRGSTFLRCMLSVNDARFPKYPRLPVLECSGWEPAG